MKPRCRNLSRTPSTPTPAHAYARAERDKLWRKVWLQAGRVEDLPQVGSFITYDILDDSVLIVRTAPDTIKAYHNVCAHRGRRLVDTPPGARNASGRRQQFVCGLPRLALQPRGREHAHPPQGRLAGRTERSVQRPAERQRRHLGRLGLDQPRSRLRTAARLPRTCRDHARSRSSCRTCAVRWRKWGIFDCNWKVALEAFNETYHVQTTHPEFNKFGEFRGWARTHGKHSNLGYEAPKGMDENQSAKLRVGTNADPRISTAQMQVYTWEKANTNTTQTLVDAALRLESELPEGTPAGEVLKHWLASARRDDAARGVIWPTVDPETRRRERHRLADLPELPDRARRQQRPVLQRAALRLRSGQVHFRGGGVRTVPAGEEPQTQWEFCPPTAEAWCYVLSQDFSNMAAVQQGMKSAGFSGPKPNPYMERSTANLHRNLAKYMGTGAPQKLKDTK